MILSFSRSMRTRTALAAALLALSAPLGAQATITSALTTSAGPFGPGMSAFQSFGQSFTAPSASAARLTSFSMYLSSFFNGAAVRFDAYIYAFDVTNRRITGSALASFLNLAGSGNEFDFDRRTFTASVLLNPSTTYMFLVTTSNQSGIPADASDLVGGNDRGSYAGGAFWVASNGANFAALSTPGAFSTLDGVNDLAFDATFAATAVIPEPATVVLTGIGLVGLGFVSRRRQRDWT
jgi:hypothetical protein